MPQVPNNVKFGAPLMLASFIVFAIALFLGAQLVDMESEAADDNGAANGGEPTLPAGPVTTTIVAKNVAFDKRSLTANSGSEFTVTLDNQDAGVSHNIAFYTNRQASAPLVPGQSVGEVFAGPAQRMLTFTPPRPGTFFFRCDVHPDTMTGSFVVN